jgi:hypothetical protein
MEEIMECLLTKIDARMATSTKAMQERMEAKMKEIMATQFGSLAAILDGWRKQMGQEARPRI